ncbi:MAG: hypothetical protein JWM96_1129 [Alphaproteobacteria bacterium]|nr:hypothetical protein [Alphaproteobacteria bacterium]
MRLSFLLQLAVLIVLGCCVYNVANKYQAIERNVRNLDAKSEQERETIRVLQAEWAFLTSPVRLEKVARDYLSLEALNGRQFAEVANIPLKEALDAQEAENQLAQNNAKAKMAPQQSPAEQAATVTALNDENNYKPTALPEPAALPTMTAIPVSASGPMGDME